VGTRAARRPAPSVGLERKECRDSSPNPDGKAQKDPGGPCIADGRHALGNEGFAERVMDMKHAQAGTVQLAGADAGAPQGLELRHLRYFVALADAGNFTHAAERMFIAQPTLSQQIRRLEQIIGTRLLQRRREGLRLTRAGMVLLGASRDVLSLVDHGMSRTRQAAGLGRQRLRVVVPLRLPEALAVRAVSVLRSAAGAADVDVVWLETPLDAEFSLIQHGRLTPAWAG
jgi:LysR family transcriptional regulator, benzoate and cis,cis-muconate-responsive activator of ben and cat genes